MILMLIGPHIVRLLGLVNWILVCCEFRRVSDCREIDPILKMLYWRIYSISKGFSAFCEIESCVF